MTLEKGDVVSCRSCGADIVFLRTASGKTMPVNADTIEPGDTEFEYGRHVSHFSTCDQPGRFRKKTT
jgi:hypothetical protein